MGEEPAKDGDWSQSLAPAFIGTFLPGLATGWLTVLLYEKLLVMPHKWAALPAMTAAIFTPAFVACAIRWRLPVFRKVLGANLVIGLLISAFAEPRFSGLLPGIAYTLPPAFLMAWLSYLALDRRSRHRYWVFAGFAAIYLLAQLLQIWQRKGLTPQAGNSANSWIDVTGASGAVRFIMPASTAPGPHS